MKLNKLITLTFFLGLILLSCVRRPAPETNTLSDRLDSLFRTIPDFSGVVLVADKGIAAYHKAFGFRDIGRKTPMDTTSIFEVASISKQFTAMIIMMLEERGKLSYDDSLNMYFPDLPYPGICVRHLLTHTSGLPDYQAIMDQYWDKSEIAGNADNIEYLIRYHPKAAFRPGEKYEYSNTGYMLLASIAEQVSGEDFITLCRNWIFNPLGMTSTDIRTAQQKKQLEKFALGHIYVAEKNRYVSADSFPEFNYAIWLGNRKGPGRISSTTGDLLKWDRALYTEKLIKPTTLKTAFTPIKLSTDSLSNYGFGWMLSIDPRFGNVVYHTGDNPGYRTEIIRYIDIDKTIIFLNNNAHERKTEIISSIKSIVLGSALVAED
jgi:CubicO group peptidase (beta-lactamase class C family)